MKAMVTYIWDKAEKLYTAYIDGILVCGEGKTREEALENLREGLDFLIEEDGLQAMQSYLGSKIEYEEVEFAQLA